MPTTSQNKNKPIDTPLTKAYPPPRVAELGCRGGNEVWGP